MRLLVCGGRDYGNRAFVFETLDRIHAERPVTVVIEGGAYGADMLARQWAIERGIDRATVRAEWRKYGKSAGFMRNTAMLHWGPHLVVAFPGGAGTGNMMRQARAAGVPVLEPALQNSK